MPIDFHDQVNRLTYAQRQAGDGWAKGIRATVSPEGRHVIDVGCGGGVYCAAWLDLGAASVVGVDFSAAILSGARETLGGRPGLTFHQGDALETGLPDGCADIVFQRALVHHIDDLAACFAEARRLLVPGGSLVVQDRTFEDATHPGSPAHLRGYFFERFPALLDIERKRRPSTAEVELAMHAAGFGEVRIRPLLETRREYADKQEVRQDLMRRTGRSILHELTDAQLAELADYVDDRLPAGERIREADHWSLWVTE
ncbi:MULTISPECIES: class I SAM-dependent methyltransferase [unclassified Streptomyces]|uniref:class I SAM-dependent methyltransferase n=1 Tax=unclassified Streptomyces TaxID=2593676 RepID=UPI00035C14C7|nr:MULTISPECIES: class I SAM-dependent methyltransferase [unclassified Streptomyces]MYT32985.1 methyltransferase domain-containing protein [Streptomyces sp. SID8354]